MALSKQLVENDKVKKQRGLIQLGEKGGYFVPVSHRELDGLIGRLMQMCDLIGDVEQRRALKYTIKSINREWLDGLYSDHGYDKYEGVRIGYTPTVIEVPDITEDFAAYRIEL